MAFIPPNARWYLANLVVEFRIEGDDESLVHVDTVLVEATSPEIGYEKALEFGRQRNLSYTNTDNKAVESVFRGLRDLTVIFDGELEDGSELIYEEIRGLHPEEIQSLISAKEDLGVFE